MLSLIQDGNEDAPVHILLAHGAGAPATNRFLSAISDLLAKRGLRVSRFNFAYMAAFVKSGKRRPPPKIPVLEEEYLALVREVAAATPRMRLVIGGKSMGGRVASLIADRLHGEGLISGLVCLGYPFHPTGKPDRLRVAHLASLSCPALIVQGERDPFGNAAEVKGYDLSNAINLHWACDGDHDLGPRGASGFTLTGNLNAAADAVAAFTRRL
jgi:predicted alpha/beta-hydrolase family hydrolase